MQFKCRTATLLIFLSAFSDEAARSRYIQYENAAANVKCMHEYFINTAHTAFTSGA